MIIWCIILKIKPDQSVQLGIYYLSYPILITDLIAFSMRPTPVEQVGSRAD